MFWRLRHTCCIGTGASVVQSSTTGNRRSRVACSCSRVASAGPSPSTRACRASTCCLHSAVPGWDTLLAKSQTLVTAYAQNSTEHRQVHLLIEVIRSTSMPQVYINVFENSLFQMETSVISSRRLAKRMFVYRGWSVPGCKWLPL